MNDTVYELREFSYCIIDDMKAKLVEDAADQIERLRKRNNYLTQELNATDYRKREQAEEIEQLRSLITAWADAWDEQGADVQGQGSYHDVTVRRIDTGDALRKAVGR
jgi:flagellin-specific chaperone FliS